MTIAIAEPEVVEAYESYEEWQLRQPRLPRVHIAEIVREASPYPLGAKSTDPKGWAPRCLRTNGYGVIFPTLCQDCEGEGDRYEKVHSDSGICYDCEENYEYCCVCDEWLSDAPFMPCDHLMWVDGAGHTGVGESSGFWDGFRDSFERVLARMPPQNVVTLRIALAAHERWNDDLLWHDGKLLGHEGYHRHWCLEMFMRHLDDNDPGLCYGLAWMWTLEAGKTDEADDLTVQWIAEWMFGGYRNEDG